jgi:biotin transport system substrate-specific component
MQVSDTDMQLRYAVRTQVGALCIALITAGAFVAIPLPGSPVPVVLQNMFVVFTGVVLPPVHALLTVSVYLVIGAIGLPVFAGGSGGLAHFAGPTGGFLLGFPVAAWFTSVLIRAGRERPATVEATGIARQAGSVLAGFLLIYVTGVPRLAQLAQIPVTQAALIGFVPFFPFDIVKAIILVVVVKTLPASLWRSWR